MCDFVHLHCHTQYSLLDGANNIPLMMDKAKSDGQLGVAMTDHGNMFGAFKFVAEAQKRDLKPIIGCEFYMVEDRRKQSFSKIRGEKDKRYHQLLLAKNVVGYENLSKLCSLGFVEGLYGKYPRIDKEILAQYHEGIIATSCCIGAEIPQAIIEGKLDKAEELVKWWLDMFGEDFYIELQRHRGLENIDQLGISQEDVNQQLIYFASKYNIKVIATNDAHYLDEDDASSHDILLCINTGSTVDKENRMRFPSDDFFFKNQSEMKQLFSDIPESLHNTMEIYDKVEKLNLSRDVLLPAFPLPKGFGNQMDYLKHLTYEGAKKRWGSIDAKIEERLQFELDVIDKSGYPGYFLIVQDFTTIAKEMGVSVGPGRGSAAGSAVAYCTGITNIDPIKYDLLFERFLNPERISMPDIDIDFDDEGRGKIIDYVVDKYGKNQVAQIVTYGSMAAKSSIRDVGRVLDVPLFEVNRVCKMFPANPSASLNKILEERDISPKLKTALTSEDLQKAYKIRALSEADDDIGKTLRTAKKLEGSIRNTGVHACGVIITPDDITKYVPMTVAKDSDLLLTQFDNSVVENAGLLKMDFLGLKTLSIIKDCVKLVELKNNIEIDIDNISLEDEKTYELFQRGDTIGIFQFESLGMQKHLKDLKPNKFEDLIAMNALYRPGPMQYIPKFIARKLGKEEINYELDAMEEYLAETYGITVYQEQVMLLSQKLANFSKGQADMLRKGMGKKKKKIIDELYPKFKEGCLANNHPEEVVDKIWKDWEAFASYAFNKSHSTCYSLLAYQTAYLKANYPAEFMASVLSHNKNNIEKLNFFLRECKKIGIEVLPPDINESQSIFAVNEKGQIRIGMSALKGVGEAAVLSIVMEREEQGPFESFKDLVKRLDRRFLNKKYLESLVLAGAFDSFGLHRAQYFAPTGKFDSYIEAILKFGANYQQQLEESTSTLFGEATLSMLEEPKIPDVPEWKEIFLLNKEKEVVGIFASGHPLDQYKLELSHYTNCELVNFTRFASNGNQLKIAGIITEARHDVNRQGNGYCRFTLQDYMGSADLRLNKDTYQRYKDFIELGKVIFIEGIYKKGYNSDECYFNVNKVSLLAQVSEELTKSITLKLSLKSINADLINRLDQLCQIRKGNHRLKIKLYEPENQMVLKLISSGKKVTVDTDFVEKLEEMGVVYELN